MRGFGGMSILLGGEARRVQKWGSGDSSSSRGGEEGTRYRDGGLGVCRFFFKGRPGGYRGGGLGNSYFVFYLSVHYSA